MACRLFGAKRHRNKFQLNLNTDTTISIQENAFENVVCKMVGILFRP